MKERIKTLIKDALPIVDVNAEFLYEELDSLGVTTILMMLSEEYGITLDSTDATPKNLKSIDSLVSLVQEKLSK